MYYMQHVDLLSVGIDRQAGFTHRCDQPEFCTVEPDTSLHEGGIINGDSANDSLNEIQRLPSWLPKAILATCNRETGRPYKYQIPPAEIVGVVAFE